MHFKKNGRNANLRPREKYLIAKRFLQENSALTVKVVCSALELDRSSFYAAAKAKKKNTRLDKEIWKDIKKLWKILPGLGYRKLTAYLGFNRKKMQRILKKFRGKKEAAKTRDKPKREFPNLLILIAKELVNHPEKLARGNWILKDGKNAYRKLIEPTRPYQLWAADWKEFKIPFIGVTVYIFAIIDVYTRQLKGYGTSLLKDAEIALKIARMAVKRSRNDPLFSPRNLIAHSDQGGAYVDKEYIAFWKKLGTSLSMADKGKPTQNPYIEAFFSILKRFWLDQWEFTSVVGLEKSLTKFFRLYNRIWKHSRIDYKTPDERLEIYRTQKNRIS